MRCIPLINSQIENFPSVGNDPVMSGGNFNKKRRLQCDATMYQIEDMQYASKGWLYFVKTGSNYQVVPVI